MDTFTHYRYLIFTALLLFFAAGSVSLAYGGEGGLDELIQSNKPLIKREVDDGGVYYAGEDFVLNEVLDGQRVTWGSKSLSGGKGKLKIIDHVFLAGGREKVVKITRGKLGERSRRYQLTAKTVVDGKKVEKIFEIRVLSEPLRVMSWNIWGKEGWKNNTQPIEPKGGEFNYKYGYRYKGKMTGQRDRVAEIIRSSKVDVVALQETYGQIDFLKKHTKLKHSFGGEGRGDNISILSRYLLTKKMSLGSDFNYRGAEIELGKTRGFAMFSSWFTSTDSGWFQDKNYSNTQGEAIDRKRRYPTAKRLRDFIVKQGYEKNAVEQPVIIAGDHNNISHLDYVAATEGLNQNYGRGVVNTPVSRLFTDAGYVDSFRTLRADVIKDPGHTYSRIYLNGASFVKAGEYPVDRSHFRIDYVYHKGPKLLPVKSYVIDTFDGKVKTFPKFGEGKKLIERGLYIFPSDHGAVVTWYEWLD